MSRPSDLEDVIKAILDLHSKVLRWMARWGYQVADCQDLAQQTTERSVNAASTYDPARAAISTWLYGRARDVAREHAKRIAHHANLFSGEPGDGPGLPSSGTSPEEEVARMEVLRFVLAKLREHLKPNLFDVLVARALHELEEGEVAEAFQWPIGTVRSRFRTAIKKAKKCLEDHEPELRSVMPLLYELDGGVTVVVPAIQPNSPRLRPAHALLVPAGAAPVLLLLLLPRCTVLLTAQKRPVQVELHLDGAGASTPEPPPACVCPATVCAGDAPLGPNAPRALVRKIDHALVHGDEPGARAALHRYLHAHPGDPLGVRAQFAWLLKR